MLPVLSAYTKECSGALHTLFANYLCSFAEMSGHYIGFRILLTKTQGYKSVSFALTQVWFFFFFYYDAFVYNKSQSDKYSVYTSEAKTVLYICLFVVPITFGALIHVNHQNWRSLTLYAESQILLHTSACDLWFCNPFITRII